MSIFKTKASSKRRLFCLFLCFVGSAQADIHSNTGVSPYWARLLHANEGVSSVVSNEFFVAPNGRFDLQAEQDTFISLLSTDAVYQVACNFPARYKWIKSQKLTSVDFDLKTCADLVQFRKGFQQKDFYLGYVTEFLDSPASAFGHLMLVFSDPKVPQELADVIHFAADSKGEKGLSYIVNGLSGGFRGYYVRDPFFKKANEYLVVEQRAIHLFKIELTQDQIENLVLHLYELRKAEFQYYFIDENCAYQLAGFLDVAVPEESYRLSPNQPVLPMDVVRRNRNRISQHLSLAPTHKRVNAIASTLTASELSEVKAVLSQQVAPNPDSTDAVKELIALQYQYAFRRAKKPYPNHTEVDLLDFKKSTNIVELDDPLDRSTRKVGLSTGVVSTAGQYVARIEIDPLGTVGNESLKNKESQLEVMTTSLDVANSRFKLNDLKLLKIKSTPNALGLNNPWSWGLGLSMNRYNPRGELGKEAELSTGKTFILHRFRAELGAGLGAQNLQGTQLFISPKVSAYYQFSEGVNAGVSFEDKKLPTETYSISTAFITLDGWTLKRRGLGRGNYETSLSFSWPL